jgi:hypothetical protein
MNDLEPADAVRASSSFTADWSPMVGRICYLHVGTGKTGSSAIQYALTRAQHALRARGYLYPDAAANFRHVMAGWPTAGNAAGIERLLREERIDEAIALIRPYAKNTQHLILSCEGFANRSASSLEKFAGAVRGLGYATKCLVFFRPQHEMVVSSYLQEVKVDKVAKGTTLEEYVARQLKSQWITRRWNWEERAEKLEQAFGDITVKWYPAVRRTGPAGVVEVALDWLGVHGLDGDERSASSDFIMNPTPGREAVLVLQAVNAGGFGGKKFADELLSKAQELGILGSKIELDRSILETIDASMRETNARMIARYCPELSPRDELQLPPALDQQREVDRRVLNDLVGIASELLSRRVGGAERDRASASLANLFKTIPQLAQPPAAQPRSISMVDGGSHQLAEDAISEEAMAPNVVASTRGGQPELAGRNDKATSPRLSTAVTQAAAGCLLHIGMLKTGTSSIQESLAGFADDRFVWYPDHAGRKNHTAAVCEMLGITSPVQRQRNGRDASTRLEGGPDRDTQRTLDNTLEHLGQRKLIISGEAIPFLSHAEIRELAEFLAQRQLGPVKAVAYIRPPASYITSVSRATKGGGLTNLRVERLSVRYRERFEKFDEIFGRENILLWKFDPQTFPSGDVVQDFCSKLGIDFPTDRIVRVNESLSREAVALLYTYHRFGAELGSRTMIGGQRFQLIERLGNVGNTKFRFSPDLLRPFLQSNRADIEWMEERLGASLHEELGEHQPGDVREEDDLLRPDPKVASLLRERLGDAAPAGVKGETPEEIAILVHALRETGRPARGLLRRRMGGRRPVQPRGQASAPEAAQQPQRENNGKIEISDIVAHIERADPGLLNEISPDAAHRFVHSMFDCIAGKLAEADDGLVNVAHLGRFRVIRGGRSEATGKDLSRISFRPAGRTRGST